MTDLPYPTVFIRTDAGHQLGMGHLYRCLGLLQELGGREVRVFISEDFPPAARMLEQYGVNYQRIGDDAHFTRLCQEQKPGLIIIDRLDTDAAFIRTLRETGAKVVTFEDLGPGASEADLVVNDLYKNLQMNPAKQLSGLQNAIMSPAFDKASPRAELRREVGNILITYGGTDPSRLTEIALQGFQKAGYRGEITVVLGPGRSDQVPDLSQYGLRGEVFKNMADMASLMARADLALCSAGRTVTELMVMGVPMLVMCQNMKELMHTHSNCQYGAINLGLGTHVSVDTLAAHIRLFMDYELRHTLHERALYEIAGRRNRDIVARIFHHLE